MPQGSELWLGLRVSRFERKIKNICLTTGRRGDTVFKKLLPLILSAFQRNIDSDPPKTAVYPFEGESGCPKVAIKFYDANSKLQTPK